MRYLFDDKEFTKGDNSVALIEVYIIGRKVP